MLKLFAPRTTARSLRPLSSATFRHATVSVVNSRRGYASEAEEKDVVIIGGGVAGYVAAIKAGQAGIKFTCIEKQDTLGGTCLNVGCIPSKSLLNNTSLYHQIIHDSKTRGIDVGDVKMNLPNLMKAKDTSVTSLTKGIEWIKGTGRFEDEHTIAVDLNDGGQTSKTDSFMKESQRHNPIAWCTFMRKLLKPLTLADGTHLPTGSVVHANTHMVSNDPDIGGADISSFVGPRYYKMWQQSQQGSEGGDAQKAERAGAYQFVSTSLGSLMFGYGKHACPGRFFAANEIKLLLAKMVAGFDVMLEGTTERYKNVIYEDRNNVDPTKNILLKRVSPLEA